MADTKLTGLTSFTPVLTDILYAVDDPGGTPVSGKVTLTAVQTLLGATFQSKPSEGAFANGDKTKLDGIEALADVTDAANVETAIEAITLTAVTGATGDEVLIVDATDGGLKAVLWENLPGGAGGDAWSDAVNADIVPDADGTRDLGSVTNRFAELHVDSIDLNGTTLDGTTLAAPSEDTIIGFDFSANQIINYTRGTGITTTDTVLSVDTSVVPTLTGTQTLTNKTITMGGTLNVNGQQIEGYTNKVVTSVTGTLTTTAHSGNAIVTSGNVTVPTTAGFTCVIIAGGAHTVSFNSTTSAAMAAGDVMTVVVQSATVIHAVLTAAADKVSFT